MSTKTICTHHPDFARILLEDGIEVCGICGAIADQNGDFNIEITRQIRQ